MVQRFDHRDRAPAVFQRGTNLCQKAESVIDALRFLLNCGRGPLRCLLVSLRFKNLLKRGKRAQVDVICNGERLEILKVLLA